MQFGYRKGLFLVLLFAASSCFAGCGAPVVAYSSTASSGSPAATLSPQTAIAVSVSPSNRSLHAGQTVQLTSVVTNTKNQGVNWTSSPIGVGEVSSTGLFTAPTLVSSAQTIIVTATSQADTHHSANATLLLQPAVSVSVSPSLRSLQGGQAVQFTADVKNTEDRAVVWTSSPAGFGSINSTGLYTATATVNNAPTITVTATSQAEPLRAASATLNLQPDTVVSISPASIVLQGGEAVQLAAAVTNAANTAVTWRSSPLGVGLSAVPDWTPRQLPSPALKSSASQLPAKATQLAPLPRSLP